MAYFTHAPPGRPRILPKSCKAIVFLLGSFGGNDIELSQQSFGFQ